MNARLSMPAFAVVSSEPKQTARAEVALHAGPAEPERRSDMADDDSSIDGYVYSLEDHTRFVANMQMREERRAALLRLIAHQNEVRARIERAKSLRREIASHREIASDSAVHKLDIWLEGKIEEIESKLLKIRSTIDSSADILEEDHTPPLEECEWSEIAILQRELHALADRSARYVTYAFDWQKADPTCRPPDFLLLSEKTVLPTEGRRILEAMRTCVGVLSAAIDPMVPGYTSLKDGDDLARLELVRGILLDAAVPGATPPGRPSFGLQEAIHCAPQLAKILAFPELKQLYEMAVQEKLGHRVLSKRSKGASKVARWVEAAWLLAQKLPIQTGEVRGWEKQLKKDGLIVGGESKAPPKKKKRPSTKAPVAKTPSKRRDKSPKTPRSR